MIKKLRESEFFNSVATLASGTILAQVIAFAVSPILTRLYSAEEMSYLSVFSRLVMFLGVIATIRMEVAFTLPKRTEHAFSLYRVSLRSLLIVTVLTLIGSVLFQFVPVADQKMHALVLFLPFGVFAYAWNNQGINWAIRLKDFKQISRSRILQSLTNAVLSVGAFPLGFLGIILSSVVSTFLAALLFLKDFKRIKEHMKLFRLSGRDYAVFKSYTEFPLINLPHALIDLVKELFIAIFMVSAFQKEALGFYDLSFRMLKLPISIIGAAIGQVFLKKAVDLRNDGKPIYPLLKRTLFVLFALSIVPFGMILLFGPELFAFVFGEHWREAGIYSQIMAPWLMVNFLTSPVSQVPLILNKQRGFFFMGLASTLLMIGALTIGYWWPESNWNLEEILKLVSITQSLLLLVVIVWMLRLAKHHDFGRQG
jgi:O-antigen/teichoic acid export membrane protein